MRNEVLIIRETIFKMEKPFSLKQLFNELKKNGITDKELIFKVLNELLDSGLVSLSDICDNQTTYISSILTALPFLGHFPRTASNLVPDHALDSPPFILLSLQNRSFRPQSHRVSPSFPPRRDGSRFGSHCARIGYCTTRHSKTAPFPFSEPQWQVGSSAQRRFLVCGMRAEHQCRSATSFRSRRSSRQGPRAFHSHTHRCQARQDAFFSHKARLTIRANRGRQSPPASIFSSHTGNREDGEPLCRAENTPP